MDFQLKTADLDVRNKKVWHIIKKKHQPKIRLRFSAKKSTLDDDLLNIPLFMTNQCQNLMELALHNF